MNQFEQLKERLSEVGLKATQQRMVIFHSIMTSKNHPSAENIFEQVKSSNPSLSLATIYSTLETLVDKGLVKKVLVKDGVMRYDAHIGTHNHIYCTNTSEIIDFEDEELNQMIKKFLASKNIENLNIKDISLHIEGEKIDKRKSVKIN